MAPALALHHAKLDITLRSARCVLRCAVSSDARVLREARQRNQAHLRPWMPQGIQQGTSLTEVSSAIARDRTLWRLGVQYAFLAFGAAPTDASKPEQVFGRVTLSNVQRGAFQCAYLGYWVDVDHCGQGLAGELVGRVVRFAFEDLGLHRVQAAVMPENLASQRVLARLGFRLEGRATRYLEIAGAWRDHDLFALLADEAPPASAGP